jgi:hypothetical protein
MSVGCRGDYYGVDVGEVEHVLRVGIEAGSGEVSEASPR